MTVLNAMPTVYVCSLAADSTLLQKSWLNRAAEMLAPQPPPHRRPFVHSELFFPNEHANLRNELQHGVSARIVYGGRVELGAKEFNRHTWHFDALSVTPQQRVQMLDWLERHKGAKFDYLGYATGCTAQNRFYCSRLVGRCLQEGGVMPNLMPHDMSHPERLSHAVAMHDSAFIGTPRAICSTRVVL